VRTPFCLAANRYINTILVKEGAIMPYPVIANAVSNLLQDLLKKGAEQAGAQLVGEGGKKVLQAVGSGSWNALINSGLILVASEAAGQLAEVAAEYGPEVAEKAGKLIKDGASVVLIGVHEGSVFTAGIVEDAIEAGQPFAEKLREQLAEGASAVAVGTIVGGEVIQRTAAKAVKGLASLFAQN